ncbi:ATP-binding cassette domain-containing protein [Bradyrhizobium sp. CCBAU 21360]|uniref:ATP-binding cassette domain-containing protein n=1 Tax=Bradyrhizobium sp. CCBAU 21360 TaxID=1325081 RepID=UPI002306861A|nr:ATP-binding cassette domain-containing protein [Bradyrhizobium sp. CCBAU 21360]
MFKKVVELLGIERLLDRSPAHLSASERQLVAIGRALLSRPRVILIDEALASVDRFAKREILPYLQRLNEKLAVPMIYMSHDMPEIEHLADHLVTMERGSTGPLQTLPSDPALPLAAGHEPAVSRAMDRVSISPDLRLICKRRRNAMGIRRADEQLN